MTDTVNRGKQAESILNNPVYKDAYKILHDNLMLKIEQSKVSESAEREILYLMVHVLKSTESQLNKIMNKGSYEDKAITANVKMLRKSNAFRK